MRPLIILLLLVIGIVVVVLFVFFKEDTHNLFHSGKKHISPGLHQRIDTKHFEE